MRSVIGIDPIVVRAERGEFMMRPMADSQKIFANPYVVVVGAGTVGLATGLGFEDRGLKVSYVDISGERTEELRSQGRDAWGPDELSGRNPNFYLISVPTSTVHGRIDLGPVTSAAGAIGRALRAQEEWSCVVVRSTVPPGTTDGLVRRVLEEESGKHAGVDFGLCMNPEFLRAATAFEDFVDPRVILYGVADAATESAMRQLYAGWPDVDKIAMSVAEAEATKYTANLFNAVKISFFNEMHYFLESMGIDSTVPFSSAAQGAEGLWNNLYGTRGGQPFGGVCLPKDSAAFLGFAEDHGADLVLLRAAIALNERHGGERLTRASLDR